MGTLGGWIMGWFCLMAILVVQPLDMKRKGGFWVFNACKSIIGCWVKMCWVSLNLVWTGMKEF